MFAPLSVMSDPVAVQCLFSTYQLLNATDPEVVVTHPSCSSDALFSVRIRELRYTRGGEKYLILAS